MSMSYQDVLQRLIEERYRMSLSQMEMSHLLRMDQSNYSKVELGFRRLSYSELEHLCESNVDVHYIYTGLRNIGQYTDFFCKCSYSELLCFLSITYSIAVLRCREDATGKWRSILEKMKYVPLIEDKQSPSNIFLDLRRSLDWSQMKMARTIGVDVKKLRDLENGRKLPDSELVSRLYELFQIPPAAVFRDKKCMESAISVFMEQLDAKEGKQLFEIMKALHNMK